MTGLTLKMWGTIILILTTKRYRLEVCIIKITPFALACLENLGKELWSDITHVLFQLDILLMAFKIFYV